MPFALICSPEGAVTESLRILLGADWTIFSETSAVGLLRLVDEVPADAVFVDEYVRDAQLVDVVHTLRRRDPDLTVVALALSTRTPRVTAALSAGLDEVLTKPFDRDNLALLLHRIRERLRRWAAAAESPPVAAPVPAAPAPAEESLLESRALTRALRTVFRAAGNQTDPTRTAQLLLEALCELCGPDRGAILWRDPAGQYRPLATLGVPHDRVTAVTFTDTSGLVSWMRARHQMCLWPGTEGLPTLVQQEMRLLQAAVAVPLVIEGQVRGVLTLGNKLTGTGFDAGELDLIVCVAQYAATVLGNAMAQGEARAHRALFEGVVHDLASGVVMVDQDGIVQVMNAAAGRTLDVAPSEVLGQPTERLGSLVADLLLRTLAGETEYRRHRVVNPATQHPLGVNTSRLRDETGAIVGAIMVCTSLAGVDMAPVGVGAAAEVAEDTWNLFALGMAHAIKNPLVAIKTFAQLFPEHHDDPEFATSFHAVALREVDRLDQLVEDLMRYGGDGDLEREPCDLNDVVTDAVARQETMSGGGAAVEVDGPVEPVMTLADRQELGDALAHVLTNAREAAGAGGHVWVRARCQQNGGSGAVIEVEDSGPGFPADAAPRVFSPFFTTKEKGLGLGLALTERTTRRHGGEVVIGKSDRGGGARVELRLPLVKANGA